MSLEKMPSPLMSFAQKRPFVDYTVHSFIFVYFKLTSNDIPHIFQTTALGFMMISAQADHTKEMRVKSEI